MPTDLWAAYTPDEKQPWNLQRVVHLHRRSAFAGYRIGRYRRIS